MAEVYLAKCFGVSGFDRLVALKRILPTIAEDDEFIAMFIDEAKIAGQLSHSNVAQIFDLGKINASYFIAMEYISGHDLRVLWDRTKQGGMPLDLCCYVVRKICEGLDYAHRRRDSRGRPLGIIHRDVSPQNILLSYDGDTKVIDFGIAKAANRMVKTQTGILKGKFAYMAPEQAKGEATDHRADIFAIGVILYELITGERAFKGDTDFALLEKVRRVDIVPPRKIRADIPRDLERIVYKALAQKASDRYGWASDMAADLDAFMSEHALSYNKRELGAFVKNAFVEEYAEESKRLDVYNAFRLEGDDEEEEAFDNEAGTAVHHQAHSATNDLHDAGTEVAADDVLSYEESEESNYEDSYSDEAYSEEADAFEEGATEAFSPPASFDESEPSLDTHTSALEVSHEVASEDINDESSDDDDPAGETRVNVSRPQFRADSFPDEATQVDDSPIVDPSFEELSEPSIEALAAQLPPPSLTDEAGTPSLTGEGTNASVTLPPGVPSLSLSKLPPGPTHDEKKESQAQESPAQDAPDVLDSIAEKKGDPSSLGDVLKDAPPSERGPRPATHPRLKISEEHLASDAYAKDSAANFNAPIPMTSAPIARPQSNKIAFAAVAALALVVGLLFGAVLSAALVSVPEPNVIVDTRPAGARVMAGDTVVCEKTPCTFRIDEPQEVTIEKLGADTEKVTRKLVPSEMIQLLRIVLDEVKLVKKVESNPSGASVSLNGSLIGKTPVDLPSLTEGTKVLLSLKKAGRITQTLTLEVNDQGDLWKPVELPSEKTTWMVSANPKDSVVTPPNSSWGFPSRAEVKVPFGEGAAVVLERPGCKRSVVVVDGNGKTTDKKEVKLECPPLDGRLTLRAPKVASVRIAGILFSAKAVRNYPLPVGNYTIVVGYRGKEQAQQVELKKGKPVTLSFFR